MVITLCTIQDRALVFAARIHLTTTPETRAAIAHYGECLRQGAKPGAVTLINYAVAMRCYRMPEYEDFTAYLLDNEVALLNDSIARAVAILENESRKVRR